MIKAAICDDEANTRAYLTSLLRAQPARPLRNHKIYHRRGIPATWRPGRRHLQEKSKDSFWEQRIENHKKFMELQQEAAARRRLMLKLQRGEPLSAAELLMGLL